MSKTREVFPLSPKKPLKKTIASMIIWAFLFVFLYGFGIVTLFSTGSIQSGSLILILTAAIVILFCIIFGITYSYQKWYYEVYFYDLTQDFIVIKKGVITPKEITIPYERIQDVYVDQDILDRIFALFDVHLASATASSGMEAHIDGVEKPASDGLKQILLSTIHQRISKVRTPSSSETNQKEVVTEPPASEPDLKPPINE